MNFIPSVLNLEIVKDFFKESDWYSTSKRIIEVKPDGRKENGFDYYEYLWENEGSQLRMEFERRGRGLRLIETDEYLISVDLEASELVFGKDYQVSYYIRNKRNQPIEVLLTGSNDKNIEFDFEKTLYVNDEIKVEGTFKVNEIREEQSIWRTHPAVTTTVDINGKRVCLKVGIVPKFPVKISAKVPSYESFLNVPSVFYIDVENNYNEEIELNFQLPNIDFITIDKGSNLIVLGGKEKKSIPISYILSDFGFYSAPIELEVKLKNENSFSFNKEIGIAFKGLGAKFSGECDEYWHIHNGPYQVLLRKLNNSYLPSRTYLKGYPTRILAPKLGKPFSLEFTKKRAESVEMFEDKGTITIKATYHSGDFKGLQLVSFMKLYPEGMLEQYYEITNTTDEETKEAIWLDHPVAQELNDLVIPYDDKILQLNDTTGIEYKDWECRRITENWLFTKGNQMPTGISWSPEIKLRFESWFMVFEFPLGKISPQKTMKTKPVYISLGAYQNWENFRVFALSQRKVKEMPALNPIAFTLKDHNPVVKADQVVTTLKNYKTEYFDGQIEVNLLDEENPQLSKDFSQEDGINEIDLVVKTNHNPINVISLKGNFSAREEALHILCLKEGKKNILQEERIEDGKLIYYVDNDSIQIKASPEFFPTLHSMVYKGQEWLDSSFPTARAKSWWNPWGGGIGYSMKELNNNSLNKTNRKCSFASIKDNYGNEWRGIKLEVMLEDHPKYKGLGWNQYYLLLPGVPMVCSVVEVIQQTGKFLHNSENTWFSDAFLKLSERYEAGWMKTLDKKGKLTKYLTSKGAVEIRSEASMICGSSERNGILQIITDHSSSMMEYYCNKEVILVGNFQSLNMENGKNYFTNPVFYTFSQQPIPEDALVDLKNLRFKRKIEK
ncbi:hypothetical protein [Alkaliphilus transvaalensis]|uniref:hypothetical protein n=1 Tax=Alkaliphilus transvaalensis TaxID=114628 RepID=UPI0006891053|nr:hypothetical protein [Alkaliphilus transvaalensis]